MQLRVDVLNKQLLLDFDDEEFALFQLLGPTFMSQLEVRLDNVLKNEAQEYRHKQRDSIRDKISNATTQELADVLNLLAKPKP